LIRHVGHIGEVRITCCNSVIQRRSIAANDRNGGACLGQLRRDGPADTAAATGYQRMRRTRQSRHALAPERGPQKGFSAYILYFKLLQGSGRPVSIAL
jgi:hypothetical protein